MASATLALVVVGVANIAVARVVSRDLAVRDAVDHGRSFATSISGSLLHEGLLRGDPVSGAALGELVDGHKRASSLVHVKVWAPDGTVLWADQAELRGRVFELEPEVERLFDSGDAVGHVTQLDRPEHVAGRTERQLLEVYAATTSPTGDRFLVESYWSAAQLEEHSWAGLAWIAPVSVGGLLVFALVVFPLASSLVRRVERVQGENSVLLQHSLDASDLERHRIVRDLHDGVMQDLHVLGYKLSLGADDDRVPSTAVDELVDRVRRISAALRSTMADLYPVDLESHGLAPAVVELAARAEEESGVRVTIDVDALDGQALPALRLSYRVIREGLRNVVRHAAASRADVRTWLEGDLVRVRVDDDGRGPGGGEGSGVHLGLALLRDTTGDVGGSLSVTRRPGGGTRLEATFPRDLAPA
ncbi:sensor histidine kinase [Nocardioides aurantiacus]|uniref:sensor histidine kinase n=1 Tax=Nocardioides aurantiacus TaxID=86796 RepID=UPI001477391A|nr:ATP-binding protein [Nocardioides aurantiacus]